MSEVRTCIGCGTLQSYPRPVCTGCRGRAFAAATFPRPGSIYSLTTVQRAPQPRFADAVPYTIALIRGESGGLLMMRVEDFGCAPAIGDAVSIEATTDGLVARLATEV